MFPGSDSENFDEALSAIYRAWAPTTIPSQIKNILQEAKEKILSPSSSTFWILAKALSEFVDAEMRLPVSGILPDMKADTESFVKLQSIYRQKARQDANEIKKYVLNILPLLGKSSEAISEDEIDMFCKNAAFLSVIGYRSLDMEYQFPNIPLLNSKLQDLDDNIGNCFPFLKEN